MSAPNNSTVPNGLCESAKNPAPQQMDQLSEGTIKLIQNFIVIRLLLVVVLVFAIYWYLFPRITEFFANPRSEPLRGEKKAIQS